MAVVIWLWLYGCCYMAVVIWLLLYGCCYMAVVIWLWLYGCCYTAVVIWLLLYGCFVYHILSYSFVSVLYHCIYGCMFCLLLFNVVNCVIVLFGLSILIVTYVKFCVLFVCKCVLYCCTVCV
jgi:hypothetical protein